MQKRYSIFLDSSALISGLNSPTGGAGIIISAFLAGEFLVYISDQVVEEVERAVQTKFPLLEERFLNFLLARPKIIGNPTLKEVRQAYKLIQSADAPILAAAIKAKPDFLITWDKRDFLKREILVHMTFIICTPKDFIQKYWKC